MGLKEYLSESVQGDFQTRIKKAKKGECKSIIDDITKAFNDKKINEKEFDMLTAMAGRKMDSLEESNESEELNEYSKSMGYKKIENSIGILSNYLDPESRVAKSIIAEFGEGYRDDFKEMSEKIEDIYMIWSEIDRDVSH